MRQSKIEKEREAFASSLDEMQESILGLSVSCNSFGNTSQCFGSNEEGKRDKREKRKTIRGNTSNSTSQNTKSTASKSRHFSESRARAKLEYEGLEKLLQRLEETALWLKQTQLSYNEELEKIPQASPIHENEFEKIKDRKVDTPEDLIIHTMYRGGSIRTDKKEESTSKFGPNEAPEVDLDGLQIQQGIERPGPTLHASDLDGVDGEEEPCQNQGEKGKIKEVKHLLRSRVASEKLSKSKTGMHDSIRSDNQEVEDEEGEGSVDNIQETLHDRSKRDCEEQSENEDEISCSSAASTGTSYTYSSSKWRRHHYRESKDTVISSSAASSFAPENGRSNVENQHHRYSHGQSFAPAQYLQGQGI